MSHDTIADASATLDRHSQAKRAPQWAPSAHAPRVAIVHDRPVAYAGAERVLVCPSQADGEHIGHSLAGRHAWGPGIDAHLSRCCLSAGSSLKNARRSNRRSMTGSDLYRQCARHAAGMGSCRNRDNNYPKGTNDVESH